jgi:hypothetical protein
LLAIYTWVNDERALVLLPARRENAAHAQDVGYLRLIAAPLAAWTGRCHRLAFSTLKVPHCWKLAGSCTRVHAKLADMCTPCINVGPNVYQI